MKTTVTDKNLVEMPDLSPVLTSSYCSTVFFIACTGKTVKFPSKEILHGYAGQTFFSFRKFAVYCSTFPLHFLLHNRKLPSSEIEGNL